MKTPIRAAVAGYGNVGRYAVAALQAAEDFSLAGVLRRRPERPDGLSQDVPVVSRIEDLGGVDVVLLCSPTRSVPDLAEQLLRQGMHTVDSYDIHGELVSVRDRLDKTARQAGTVAMVSSGWDPGTDSMVRAIMEIMAPQGITYTNFGPGMSMGHSVAAKAVDGVRDALSMTLPAGAGVHRRMVYVALDNDAEFESVKEAILADPYFVHDETHVQAVPSVADLIDVGHGVHMERKGVSGATHNQRFQYSMEINNPALTSQVMVAAARAALRQEPGAYTLLEVPLIDLLPGDRDALLRRLV